MEIQRPVLKTLSFRTCLPAGVWTLCVAREQISTTVHGLTDRGTPYRSYSCSGVLIFYAFLSHFVIVN